MAAATTSRRRALPHRIGGELLGRRLRGIAKVEKAPRRGARDDATAHDDDPARPRVAAAF